MKRTKFAALIFSILMIVTMLPTTILAMPSAVTVADTANESVSVAVEDKASLSADETQIGPFAIDWSGPADTVNTPEFDLYSYLPSDTIVTSVSIPVASIVSGVSPTWSDNEAKIKIKTNTYEEPASGTVSVTVSTENYGDVVFNINITLTGKYIVTISGVEYNSIVYDGNPYVGFYGTPSGTSKAGAYDGEFDYSYSTADGTALDKAPTEAGKYKVTISVPEDNENYKGNRTLNFAILSDAEASYADADNNEIRTSLTEAVRNVPADGTITLLSDIDMLDRITTYKNFKLDGDSHTITTSLASHSYYFVLNAVVELEDVVFDGGSENGSVSSSCMIAVGNGGDGTGTVTTNGVTFQNNNNTKENGYGGAITVFTGTLNFGTIAQDTVTNCSAYNGGAISVHNGNSANLGKYAVIENNTASNLAGGVYVAKGTVTFDGAKVNDNTASKNGGAIYVLAGSATVKGGAEVKNNYAASVGGAIFVNYNGTALYVEDCTITGNSTDNFAGGIECSPFSKIYISGKPVISGNTSNEETDGGVYLDGHPSYGYPTIKISALSEGADVNFYTWMETDGFIIAYPYDGDNEDTSDDYTITSSDMSLMEYDGENYRLSLDEEGKIILEDKYIEIDLGARSAETNVRYAEIDGVVTAIEENEDKYIVEISENNLLIEVVEKTAEGEFVKSQYFYVDMTEKTAAKLTMDSYMTTNGEKSIRIKDPMGMRFKSVVTTASKKEEVEYVIDEYGFIVATEDALGETELTLDFSKYVTGVAYNREDGTDIIFDASNDEYHVFSGYVKNVPVANYKTNLVCKTYTKITVGGESFVVYGEAVTGNIYDTANTLLADETLDTETRDALSQIIFDYENTLGLPGDELYPEE